MTKLQRNTWLNFCREENKQLRIDPDFISVYGFIFTCHNRPTYNIVILDEKKYAEFLLKYS